MGKMIRSFRLTMILYLALSMFIAGAIVYTLYKLLQFYYHNWVRVDDPLANIRMFIYSIGDFNFFLLLFIPLSILFFFFFTKRYAIYFKRISEGIHDLARGNFQHHVDIRSNDEFHEIAKDINLASETLRQAIERGDFSEHSKNHLVVNLAHDLRTPLTSVIGYLEIIQKDQTLTDEQKKHFLSIAFAKSQRLEKLIDELFEVTKLNYGLLPIHKKNLNLTDLLHQLVEELLPVFQQSNLQARVDIPIDLPISGDGDLLARLFENLITNAIRYGHDGSFVDINGFVIENEAHITIVNYGNIIPVDELPHLFDMFYTGDKARTHKSDRSGLGLFIAKNISEQHNGSIQVKSNVIQTTFEVILPLERQA